MIVRFAGHNPRAGEPFVTFEATGGGWGGETALIDNVNGSPRDLPIARDMLKANSLRVRKGDVRDISPAWLSHIRIVPCDYSIGRHDEIDEGTVDVGGGRVDRGGRVRKP
ncbi:hypothetical protein ACFWIW_27030 [Amycolatopsis sp. NPDC058340]|uniref:hypothetical protein n=1 Tax=Amycolatopsis sp. NPDC058340 TaxID=3346453 RepID=UPI0036692836